MNLDLYILILTSIGFIFGWIVGRFNYKKKLLKCIEGIEFKGTSNNEYFTASMYKGIDALKIYLKSIILDNKVGKSYLLELHSNKDLLSKSSKKNNK
ncbi:hypothetical protein CPT_Pollock84 [Escherichia phage Pollock]|uniref:Uncharacterized protein n=1 Tax=Escherichia phage Pollock TaxID=1540097 RepID=A0A0A0YUB1_9CAUD|nr:hypothetical protein ACQ44_gp82 [Escherichia phage Pollock]AIX12443.1 hypothetical protein CPT_Pollock84 [Escherichia phage Pollock]